MPLVSSSYCFIIVAFFGKISVMDTFHKNKNVYGNFLQYFYIPGVNTFIYFFRHFMVNKMYIYYLLGRDQP